MSRDFFELCYDQYKIEMEDADRIYQRGGVMLAVLPLLTASLISLGRIDLMPYLFSNWAISIYYFFVVCGLFSLSVSTYFIVRSLFPQKYKTLANMDAWLKWRQDYEAYLIENQPGNAANRNKKTDDAMMADLTKRLVEAQPRNATINERRRGFFTLSLKAAAIGLVAIAGQAAFYLILVIKGI
jgi:hypothetical protein